jgi:hypothetical protein
MQRLRFEEGTPITGEITEKHGTNQEISNSTTAITSHPNMFLNKTEINDIKSRLTSEPWLSAYKQLMNTYVPQAMYNASKLPTVVNNGPTPPSGNQHDYYTTFDHIQRQDYLAAREVAKSVRHLALAYVLSDYTSETSKSYANNAIKLIYYWCAHPDRKMNNRLFYPGQQYLAIETESVVSFPGMFYGADLIWNYNNGNWIYNGEKVKTLFIEWVQGILNDARRITRWGCGGTPYHCQNLEYGRLSLIASASVIVGDNTSLNYVYDRWKKLITGFTDTSNVVIAPIMLKNGRLTYEMSRTTPISYTLFCINHMIQVAEISRHQGGPDLYHYKVNPSEGDNRGLELAFDFISPYVINPASLGGKRANCFGGCNPVISGGMYTNTSECQVKCLHSNLGSPIYELAYSFIRNKSVYKNCINTYKRPMYDDKNMGPVTLTHGSKFV